MSVIAGMHSEDIEDHRFNSIVTDFVEERFGRESPDRVATLQRYMREHTEVVERFGRYPHRNAALGRESTAEELAWLEDEANLPGWARTQRLPRSM